MKDLAADKATSSLSIRKKGQDGEALLDDLLTSKLLMRDGFTIEDVSGQTASCDRKVNREGYAAIRIDSKMFTRKVPKRDVDKFIHDLNATNDHGILCAWASDIAGVDNFELWPLPNHKYAIFLANLNALGPDALISMIHLIHRLDGMGRDTESSGLTAEAVTRVRNKLGESIRKLQETKQHLKQALANVGDIQLEHIDQILRGQLEGGARSTKPFPCDLCSAGYESKQKLHEHWLTHHDQASWDAWEAAWKERKKQPKLAVPTSPST
jgi:hypothetical protein